MLTNRIQSNNLPSMGATELNANTVEKSRAPSMVDRITINVKEFYENIQNRLIADTEARSVHSELYHDFLLSPLENIIMRTHIVVKVFLLLISLLLYVATFVGALLQMSVSVVYKVTEISVIKKVSDHVLKIPIHFMFLLMIVLGALMSGVFRSVGAIIFILNGALFIGFSWYKAECIRYYMLAAGIIQVFFGILRTNLLSSVIRHRILVGFFGISHIAIVALILVDKFKPLPCKPKEKKNDAVDRGEGSKNSFFHN